MYELKLHYMDLVYERNNVFPKTLYTRVDTLMTAFTIRWGVLKDEQERQFVNDIRKSLNYPSIEG
jgi:hypothetical protein